MGLPSIPQAKEPRGSLHSIRRGSFDVRSVTSDGLRRTSLAKLSSLPLEAPITKVLTLLAQVQENCSNDESKLLDRVIEVLKREGLYSPQIKEIRPEDPVATDLIGALLTVRLTGGAFGLNLLSFPFTAGPYEQCLVASQLKRVDNSIRKSPIIHQYSSCEGEGSRPCFGAYGRRSRLGLRDLPSRGVDRQAASGVPWNRAFPTLWCLQHFQLRRTNV